MQTVLITLRVLHRPVESHLSDIYSQYGVDYDDRVLPSIGNEVLKAIVAMYDASELITMREHVRQSGEFLFLLLTLLTGIEPHPRGSHEARPALPPRP